MKRVFKTLGGFVAVPAVAIAGGFVYLSTVDLNAYKPDIVAAVKEATGGDLVIASPIKLDLSLTPGLQVKDVLLGNPAWAGTEPLVRVADFAVKVDLPALLGGRIVIDRLVLKDVTVDLKRDADGGANWQFEPLTRAAATPEIARETDRQADPQPAGSGPAGTMIPVIRSVRVENMTVRFADAVAGLTRTVVLNTLVAEAAPPGAPVNLTLEALYRDIAVGVSGTVGDPAVVASGGALPLDLVLNADETRITLKGVIREPLNASGADVAVTAAVPDIRALAHKALPEGLAAALPDLGAAALEMTVRGEQGRYDFSDLVLSLGQIDLSGKISADLGGAVPKLTADLTSKRIDITPFLHGTNTGSAPPTPATAPPASPAPPAPIEAVRAEAQASKERVIADTPLPLDLLTSLNAQVSLKADHVRIEPVTLTDLNLEAALEDGELTVRPLTMKVLQGDIDISARLDGTKTPPELSFDGAIAHLDIGEASKTVTGLNFGRFALAGGKIRLDTALRSAGGTVRDVAAGLHGNIDLQVDAAVLKGIDVEPLLKGDFLGALNAPREGGQTAISCMVARFDITDGVMADRGVILDTSEAALSVTGQVNLADETLDLMLRPAPKNPRLGAIAPDIIIDGTFARPVVSLSAQSVLKGLAGIGLMALNPAAGLVSFMSGGSGEQNGCLAVLEAKAGAGEAAAPQQLDLRSILKNIPGLVPNSSDDDDTQLSQPSNPARDFLRGLLNR